MKYRGRYIIFPILATNRSGVRVLEAALDRWARLRGGRVKIRRTLIWCEEHQRRHVGRFHDVIITGTPAVQRWVYRYGVPVAKAIYQEAA